MLTLKFTLTRGEVAKILRQRLIRRWQNWACLAGAVLILAAGILLSDVALISMGVAYVLCCVVFDTVGLPWIYWRRFEQLRSEHTVIISNDGITSERARLSSRSEWAFWSDVHVLPDAYLIMAGTQAMIIIPKRVFTSSEEEHLFEKIAGSHLRGAFAPAA